MSSSQSSSAVASGAAEVDAAAVAAAAGAGACSAELPAASPGAELGAAADEPSAVGPCEGAAALFSLAGTSLSLDTPLSKFMAATLSAAASAQSASLLIGAGRQQVP